MSEQHLNHADINILLQKMRRKAVPQRVQRNPFVDLGHMGCRMADAVELARGHRVNRVLTWKQPGHRLADAVPLAQNVKQHGREHGKAVLAPLALLDPQHHAGAVDIRDFERHHFGGSKPRAIGNAQRRLMLGAGSGIEEPGNLLLGQHRRQLLRSLHPEQRLEKPRLVEGDAEKEPQRLHRRVNA